MRRREFIAVGLGGTVSLAGCVAAPGRPTSTDGAVRSGRPAGAVDLPVPMDALTRGAARDSIPAITDPSFGRDWGGISLEVRNSVTDRTVTISPRLSPTDPVIGIARDGTARAYPLRLLNWHEVVNDRLDGPVLVTYCPLCKTGLVARREVDGEPGLFGVSGLLWRSNLVLYDRPTGSLWSQLLARAIRGPRTGDRLSQLPSTRTTLGDWREAHPQTEVLLPPPESGTVAEVGVRNYTVNPYAAYTALDRVGLGENRFSDDRLHPKTEVIGVVSADVAVAYPRPVVARAGVVNDTVGRRPVVVTVDSTGRSLTAYDRRVDGRVLDFSVGTERDGTLWAGGSRWQIATGRAIDGPHAGRRLEPASPTGPMFWFSWLDLHPDTRLYRG